MKNSENTKKSKFKIKSIISENNKLTKAISFLFLFLIMFGLFAFIIIGLKMFGLLPEFIQNIFFKTEDAGIAAAKDDRNMYDFLHGGDNVIDFENIGGFTVEITDDNIKDIISRTRLPDNLYIETEANYYIDGKKTRIEKIYLWKKKEKCKYSLTVNSETEEIYINDSKLERIENPVTGNSITRPASDSFSFDNIPHITNINHYLELLESGEIINQHACHNSDATINIVEIKYSIPPLDQWELIYISLDTGIVMQVKTYTGEHSDQYYESNTIIREAYFDGDAQSEEKSEIHDYLFEIR